MSQIYIWQYANIPRTAACWRFEKLLEQETAFYNRQLPTRSSYFHTCCGNILIGQISCDLGIIGWLPLSQHDDLGVVWAGVCEDFLGSEQDAATVRQIIDDIYHHPEKFGGLTGSFSLCAWQESNDRTAILTGATQCQTLWQTDGSLGWALGSRARPLLALVGREPELNHEAATTFIAYGFLLDDDALFKHVKRVPSRTCIVLKQQAAPVQRVYMSLSDYFDEPLAGSFDGLVDICAEQIKHRVRRQLRHSQSPKLHLTGGRDSRCIAAALSLSGFAGPAFTGGAATSKDVVIASKVAAKLGIAHSFNDLITVGRPVVDLPRDSLQAWTRISEGVETIRHGLHYIGMINANGRFPQKIEQHFIGLHAGFATPYLKDQKPNIINQHVGPHLSNHKMVFDRFYQLKERIDSEIKALRAPRYLWSDIYEWQIGALHWGQDNATVKDLFFWWWTPLLDRTLIRASWLVPRKFRSSYAFIEAVTDRLVPGLSKLEYDKKPSRQSVINRMIRKTKRIFSELNPLPTMKQSSDDGHKDLPKWVIMLFKNKDPVWKKFIDERYLKAIVEQKKGDSDIVWSALTIELFNETFTS